MNDVANPLVSVVIPTYNHARYLARVLQSVLDQTYVNWEAIVIDNHSTDNTDEVMASFADPRIIYLKIHNNGVIAASRNAGIRAAKGEWVAFLDSDDWWTVDKLKVSIAAAEKELVDVVYHDLYIVVKLNQINFKKKIGGWALGNNAYKDLLTNGNALANSSVIIKKIILEKIGGLSEDPAKIAWEDYDCWLKVSQVSGRFHYIPEVHGFYWQGGGNTLTRKRNLSSLEMIFKIYIQNEFKQPPFWILYQLGITAFMCREFTKSANALGQLDLMSCSSFEKIKCIILLWVSRILMIANFD